MKILGQYQNGNYTTTIYDNGTKVRETIDPNADKFIADFPESMDIKITNYCDGGWNRDCSGSELCKFCHENSGLKGRHGDILDLPFLEDLIPYTEMAIGGGNPLSHPDLIPFLKLLKDRHIIPNLTVNQRHFEESFDLLKELSDKKLIYGLGISMTHPTDAFIEKVRQLPNAVLHLINGIVTMEQLDKISNKGIKILILGYKILRRGLSNFNTHCEEIEALKNMVRCALKDGLANKFAVVSFDNLAIEQLNVKEWLPKELYDRFYQGDDGSHTMYVDCVNREFAVSSTKTATRVSFDSLSLGEYFTKVKN